MTLQEQTKEKATRAVMDFIQQNSHYSGGLTKDTACQLLSSIEANIARLDSENIKLKEVAKVAKVALYDVEADSDTLPAWLYTKIAEALATIDKMEK